MQISTFDYLLLFVAAFAAVGVLTPLARRIAIKNEVFDAPNTAHKTHKEPVPYLGGVAIIVGIGLVSLAAFLFKNPTSQNFWLETSVLGPALILGFIGLWDDLKNLSPLPRFIAQTLAGLFTSFVLIQANTVGTPTSSKLLDAIITSAWIVGICNSINFFDNVDGGAAGTVAVSSTALAILAYNGDQYLITALATVTSGAMIGFLLWNKSPARIYMGDAGALFLGVLIATLTIRLHPGAETKWTSFATPILLLAVPILDTSVAVISRLRRRVSPFQGGRDHLSHRLVRAGLSRPVAAVALWLLSAFYAGCAIMIPLTHLKVEEGIVIVAGISWIALFLYFIQTSDQ
jgi:UDP-GlcNAc:undecaprenyl-phosphate GlcNAc-1-phosphate transferase